ncbi:hypothetical protein SNEBB_003517 [Seison nebaliae]|nr:hypothetical protein SNEBB_003517 [Seison nebaliae]
MSAAFNFTYSRFEEKWKILNDLNDESLGAMPILHNSKELGICLTNTIISMIFSSEKLVEIIKILRPIKKEKYVECMKIIQQDPNSCSNNSRAHSLSDGEVLSCGLCMLQHFENIDSRYGFGGNFYLARHHKEMCHSTRRKETIYIAEYECGSAIARLKDKGFAWHRWNSILSSSMKITFERREQGVSFAWYSQSGFLNLMVELQKNHIPHFWDHLPLPDILTSWFTPTSLQLVERWLKSKNTSPNFISFSYYELLNYVQIHPTFYSNLAKKIFDVNYGTTNTTTTTMTVASNGDNEDQTYFTDLRIPMCAMGLNIPNFLKEGNTLVNFNIRLLDVKKFKIKSFNLQLNEPTSFFYSRIPHLQYKGDKLENCVNSFHVNLVSYMNVKYPSKKIFSDINNKLNNLFYSMCDHYSKNRHFSSTIYANTHEIAIIPKNKDEWWILNDQYPSKVKRETLVEFLKYETVTSYLLEAQTVFSRLLIMNKH